jgi:hypothetical protein
VTTAELIYLLCAATSLLAAWLLVRQYRARRTPLLFWSSVAFVGLGLNNVMVYTDLALFADLNLALPRTLAGTVAMLALVYGLIEGTHVS